MELTISNIVKIILGLIVVVAVIYGAYKIIGGSLIDTFKNFGAENSSKFILGFLI